MQIVADVHGEFDSLAKLARSGEPLLVLGDLINYVDYRTMDGIAAEVLGKEFVRQVARFRAVGDYEGSRALWREQMAGREFGDPQADRRAGPWSNTRTPVVPWKGAFPM